jgi:hypothetical protein
MSESRTDDDLHAMIESVAEAVVALEVRVTNIEANIATHTVMLNDLKDALAEISERLEAQANLARAGNKLTVKGDIPQLNTIERIWCQVWHTPNIPKKERNRKTEWSLSFEVFCGDKKEKFDLMMYPQKEFTKRYSDQPISDRNRELISTPYTDAYGRGWLAGMIRARPPGGGRPLSPNQIAILVGHFDDAPTVLLLLGGHHVRFDDFEPGKGGSKWFAKWDKDIA